MIDYEIVRLHRPTDGRIATAVASLRRQRQRAALYLPVAGTTRRQRTGARGRLACDHVRQRPVLHVDGCPAARRDGAVPNVDARSPQQIGRRLIGPDLHREVAKGVIGQGPLAFQRDDRFSRRVHFERFERPAPFEVFPGRRQGAGAGVHRCHPDVPLPGSARTARKAEEDGRQQHARQRRLQHHARSLAGTPPRSYAVPAREPLQGARALQASGKVGRNQDRRGFSQRRPLKRAKSASVDTSTASWLTASAARCASVMRFPQCRHRPRPGRQRTRFRCATAFSLIPSCPCTPLPIDRSRRIMLT